MSRTLIDNVNNVDVSVGEFRNLTHVLNRTLTRLFENDQKLYEKYVEITGGMVIQPYDPNISATRGYDEDELVWWFDEIECMLYILRCVTDDNTHILTHNDNKNGQFDDAGWHNEFEQLNVLDFNLDQMVDNMILVEMTEHQKNPVHHRLGKVSLDEDSGHYLGDKLLSQSLKNLDYNRQHYFFPVQTVQLTADNSIIKGFYRRYDCGIIEYDINFRLGYDGETDVENFGSRTILRCNNRKLNDFTDMSNPLHAAAYQEHLKYFSGQANKIFMYENTAENNYSVIGTTVQKNRNDFVNTYFATIKLPVSFLDTNYMIFSSDMVSQTTNNETPSNGSNTMIFCDRMKNQFTAVYVTYPTTNTANFDEEGYNTRNGGLICNSFNVHIVGKCPKYRII